MKTRKKVLVVILASMLIFGVVSVSMGINLGSILKVGGVSLLVNNYGGQMNDAINKLTMNKGVAVEDRTKVVPIISVGSGSYVGAAQVSGPALQIDKVKAVAQLETKFPIVSNVRLKALIPVASKSGFSNIKRVTGVGVSAIIDIKL
ncbi:MAG: hypothetical protein ACYC0V_14605 [Armatimonadota bacterium]